MQLPQLIKSNPNKPVPSRKRRLLNVLIAIGLVMLVFDVLLVGNVAYAAKWVSCGQKPYSIYTPWVDNPEPKALSGFSTAKPALLPTPGPGPLHCSEAEAWEAWRQDRYG